MKCCIRKIYSQKHFVYIRRHYFCPNDALVVTLYRVLEKTNQSRFSQGLSFKFPFEHYICELECNQFLLQIFDHIFVYHFIAIQSIFLNQKNSERFDDPNMRFTHCVIVLCIYRSAAELVHASGCALLRLKCASPYFILCIIFDSAYRRFTDQSILTIQVAKDGVLVNFAIRKAN